MEAARRGENGNLGHPEMENMGSQEDQGAEEEGEEGEEEEEGVEEMEEMEGHRLEHQVAWTGNPKNGRRRDDRTLRK